MTDGINDDREDARGFERRLHEVAEERDSLRSSMVGAQARIDGLLVQLEKAKKDLAASEEVAHRRLQTIGQKSRELETLAAAHADAIQVACEVTEERVRREEAGKREASDRLGLVSRAALLEAGVIVGGGEGVCVACGKDTALVDLGGGPHCVPCLRVTHLTPESAAAVTRAVAGHEAHLARLKAAADAVPPEKRTKPWTPCAGPGCDHPSHAHPADCGCIRCADEKALSMDWPERKGADEA